MNEPRIFTVEERVRWSDVDAAGIICYGAYTRFLELAETELFRAAGYPYGTAFRALDIWLPRVHASMDFTRPAHLDDLLRVSAWVSRLGRSSVALEFLVEASLGDAAGAASRTGNPGPSTLMRGRLVLASVARGAMTPVPVPPALVDALRPYVRPDVRPEEPREALLHDLRVVLASRPEPAVALEVALDVLEARLRPTWLAIHVLRGAELTLHASRGSVHEQFLDAGIRRSGREVGRLAVGGASVDVPLLERIAELLAPFVH